MHGLRGPLSAVLGAKALADCGLRLIALGCRVHVDSLAETKPCQPLVHMQFEDVVVLVIGKVVPVSRRLGTEAVAWQILRRRCPSAPVAQVAWLSDIADGAQKWLRRQHPNVPILTDVNARVFKRKGEPIEHCFVARDFSGKVRKFANGACDVYVVGFPCNPWSSRGYQGELCSRSDSPCIPVGSKRVGMP
jgi:hypothetical protein